MKYTTCGNRRVLKNFETYTILYHSIFSSRASYVVTYLHIYDANETIVFKKLDYCYWLQFIVDYMTN